MSTDREVWHSDWDLDELRDLGMSLWRKSLAQLLADHWLVDIGCDHEAGTDSPVCSCSAVTLGTYESVGAAVVAWSAHVEAKIREVRGGCA